MTDFLYLRTNLNIFNFEAVKKTAIILKYYFSLSLCRSKFHFVKQILGGIFVTT
jgi:hypothetical protein